MFVTDLHVESSTLARLKADTARGGVFEVPGSNPASDTAYTQATYESEHSFTPSVLAFWFP